MPKNKNSSPADSAYESGGAPSFAGSATAGRPSPARTDGNPHSPAYGSPSDSFDPPPIDTAAHVPHEQIARHAYALWEEGGRQEGRSHEYWCAAEQQLRGRLTDSWESNAARQARGPVSDK